MPSLGVSLSICQAKGQDVEWTSLLGGEKRALLKKLPNVFETFLPPEKIDATIQTDRQTDRQTDTHTHT